MTAVEFNRLAGGSGPHHTHGWVVSLLCHLLAVGITLLGMAEIEQPILPKPFHWEVAIVEAPTPVEPTREQPAFAPAPTPIPRQRVEKVPVPVQQTVRTVEVPTDTTDATVESRASAKTIEPVQQTVRDRATSIDTPVERSAAQSIDTQTVVAKAVSLGQEPVIEQTVSSAAAVSSILERAEPVETRTVIEPSMQARQSEPVERESPSVELVSTTIEHRVVQQRMVRFRQTQADYGWLAVAIRTRIEELKRYPVQAKMNHWEGRVVVEAVIRHDGEVVELRVAESSGHTILDQEAMTAMKQASPLALRHPLGKSQVTILVPISYRLDG